MDHSVTQLTLEETAAGDGVNRYRKRQQKADETDLSPGRHLLEAAIKPLAAAIKADNEATATGTARRGRPSIYATFLRLFDPYVAAYITARACINAVGLKSDKPKTLTDLSMTIAKQLADHRLFSLLKEGDSALAGYIEAALDQAAPERRHRELRRSRQLAKFSVEDNDPLTWSNKEMARVGARLIDLFAQSTGFVFAERDRPSRGRRKRHNRVYASPKLTQYLNDKHSKLEGLAPVYTPMVVPPMEWTTPTDGGYLNLRLPLIKNMRPGALSEYAGINMDDVYTAVNSLQLVPWAINASVLDVAQEAWLAGDQLTGVLPSPDDRELPVRPGDVPEDVPFANLLADQQKRLKAWFSDTAAVREDNRRAISKRYTLDVQLMLARKFREHNIWFPYQLDFRGRIYAVPSPLSPQGDDLAKALLCFAHGKPLGADGEYWLAVHVANTFGHDKVPFDERVDWVHKHEREILDSGNDPLDGQRFWATSDDPWQSLAACTEWARYRAEGDDFVSHLPISMDASCSGLQHFSALLRDPIGGAATNLVPADEKADIYEVIADATKEKMREQDSELIVALYPYVDRKLVKQPCMTFPYGSTAHGMRTQLRDALYEASFVPPAPYDMADATLTLTPIVRACIEETVVAAASAMDWLQETAAICSRDGQPMLWITPVGFPVVQRQMRPQGTRIDINFAGKPMQLTLSEDSDAINGNAQRNGISPNYIHSLDSAHLMRTVVACGFDGLVNLGVIHDSFATHACAVSRLREHLRSEFVRLYRGVNRLGKFKRDVEAYAGVELPDPPEPGNLDLEGVKSADFLFS